MLAGSGTAATSPCVAKACVYDVQIEVSYKNPSPYFGAQRPTGTISARLRATFKGVPFRRLQNRGSRIQLGINRGMKSYESNTTAPGTLRATVNATTPCRMDQTYELPALLYAAASGASQYNSFQVAFGPERAPTPSGCAGTAFGLGKILAAGGAIDSAGGITYISLGEEVQIDVGANSSRALVGSYHTSSPVVIAPLTQIFGGRSFTVAHTWRPEATGGRSGSVGTSGSFRMTFTRTG